MNSKNEDAFRVHEPDLALTRGERMRHVFVAGRSGMGKSTFLSSLFRDDVANISEPCGICFIDPHGDEAENLVAAIPTWRTNDVAYFNVADTEFPISFNPIAGVPLDERPRRTAAVVASLAHAWRDSWGHSSEQIARNAIASLMDLGDGSLVGVPRLLTDAAYRERVVARVTDPLVRAYWRDQFELYSDEMRTQKIAPLLNKFDELLSVPTVRNILAAGRNRLNLNEMMDSRKIIVCALSKGHIGAAANNLLGSLIVSLVGAAAMARSTQSESDRRDFLLTVDEAHNYAGASFAPMLSELRKYRCGITIATQYTAQLASEVQAAIFGNVGTFVIFSVSAEDAEIIAPHFGELNSGELIDQSIGHVWSKRDIPFFRYSGSRRASVRLPAADIIEGGRRSKVIERSRRVYCLRRPNVEGILHRFF